MFRPVGNNCNLSCKYCYGSCNYKDINYLKQKNIIKTIKLFKDYHKLKEIVYIIYFHGGEPLLWGINNFKKAFNNILSLLDREQVQFRIQTNGILLNKKYLDLFKKYNVHVSTSIDGFKEINDKLRVYPKDISIYDDLIFSISLLKKYTSHSGAILVVTKLHLNKEKELYKFIKEVGISIQFNPLLKLGRANNYSKLLVTSKEYTKFIKNMFDIWFKDSNPISISNFNTIVSSIIYNKPIKYCNYGQGCVNNLYFITIDYNGDISICNRTSDMDKEYFNYGNINNIDKLEDIFKSSCYKMLSKRANDLKQDCKICKLHRLKLCNGYGGCPCESFASDNLFKLPDTCRINKVVVLYIYNKVMKYEPEFRYQIKIKE